MYKTHHKFEWHKKINQKDTHVFMNLAKTQTKTTTQSHLCIKYQNNHRKWTNLSLAMELFLDMDFGDISKSESER